MKQLSFLYILLLTRSALAQVPLEPTVTLMHRTDVRLIPRFDNDTLFLRTWDKKGSALGSFDSSDFCISKGEDTAKIIRFEKITRMSSQELSISFILDNSESMFHSYDSLTKYLDGFLDSLGEGAELSALTFDSKERKPTYDGTNRKELFLASITATEDVLQVKKFWHSYDTIRTAYTPLFDALWKTFEHINDRRSTGDSLRSDIIIVVSDGDDNCSSIAITDLQKMAASMKIPIYVLNYRSEPDDRLRWFMNHSNGTFYAASDIPALQKILHYFRRRLTSGYKIIFEFPLAGPSTRR